MGAMDRLASGAGAGGAARRSLKLYEALAADLEDLIRRGVLRAGEKMPSVRHLSSSRGVSVSTIFQAYYLLEARGLIRARERSGYYVTAAHGPAPPEPADAYRPRSDSVALDMSEMIFRILEAGRLRDSPGLASAFPNPGFFPLARLAQALASSVRSLEPAQVLEDLTPGNAALRRQIAIRYRADGINVDEQEIVITNGALEALNLCLATVTQPGDRVVIESPCFYGALQALESRGLRAVQVPTHPVGGVELEALEQAVQRHQPKACWLMTNFQNPLGCLMSPDRKMELVRLLARHEVPLIEDDVYADLFFDAQRPAPAKAYDTTGLVMHCSSFSKSLAPGFRIGWAAPGRYTHRFARNKLALSLSTSLPPQLALAEYLEHGGFDRHLRRLRTRLASQQAEMAQALTRHFPAGTTATRPRGGYLLWVELPAGLDAMQLHDQAAAEGICIAPGPMFSPDRAFRNCLRLNYGQPWNERVESSLATLGRLLREQAAQGKQ
jgi:DNA-binding transcriptional MocR family regulator